jgi:thiol-disulfide isomerase/thioredoxin
MKAKIIAILCSALYAAIVAAISAASLAFTGCIQIEAKQPPIPQSVSIVMFSAQGCYACDQAKPVLASLKVRGVNVLVYDIEAHRELADKYGITVVPIFLVKVGDKITQTCDIGTVVAICNREL